MPPSIPPTGTEIAGVAASVIWLAGGAIWMVVAPPVLATDSALRVVIGLIAALLPVMLLLGTLAFLRLGRVMRAEVAGLRAAIEAESAARERRMRTDEATPDPAVQHSLAELLAAQRRIEAALAAAPAEPPAPAPVPAPEPDPGPVPQEKTTGQADLPFGAGDEETAPPLVSADFIRALNFPDTPDDTAGFDALRRALRDRPTAQLVRAAQDVLTLMAQDGLYMDDLHPEPAPPDTWRRFSSGERGPAVAAIGGIHDEGALAQVATRMKRDPIFRDAAHHFLRLFDRIVSQFAEVAPDADITALAGTRTARAFMLLGRSAGVFD